MSSPPCHAPLRFGVISTFPELKNAEYENIERLRITCQEMGAEFHVLDVNGQRLGRTPPDTDAAAEDFLRGLDFVISLHFKTPKCFDAFTYLALWNPVQFFHDWGYGPYATNLLSFDDFLSCSSTEADAHLRRLIAFGHAHLPPRFTFYHSLSSPILPPTKGPKRLFYCGINWEKLSRTHGRYHECFLLLDRTGRVEFYGPEKFAGVRPWGDYTSYRGEIPFDGVSIVRTIAGCGVSLVFSSEAHKASALMSNRLFESCAAGAIIIADENPWGRRFLGDAALYVDGSAGPQELFRQIDGHLCWINEHPEEAFALAARAQAIFLETLSLRHSLETLAAEHSARRAELAARTLPRGPAGRTALFFPVFTPARNVLECHLRGLRQQRGAEVGGVFLVDADGFAPHADWFAQTAAGLDVVVTRIPGLGRSLSATGTAADLPAERRLGTHILDTLTCGRFEYFTVVFEHERLFAEHVGRLLRCLQDRPGAAWAFTDHLVETLDHNGAPVREMRALRVDPAFLPRQATDSFGACFLFRTASLWPELTEWIRALDLGVCPFLAAATTGEAIAHSPAPTLIVDAEHPFVERLARCREQTILRDFQAARYTGGLTDPARRPVSWPDFPPAGGVAFTSAPVVPQPPRQRLLQRIAHRLRATGNKGPRLVIFGASTGGQRVLAHLPAGTQVLAFCDNDPRKHGTSFAGCPVLSPEKIKGLDYDFVLIASMYHRQIRQQLLGLGVFAKRMRTAPVEILNGNSRAPGEELAKLLAPPDAPSK